MNILVVDPDRVSRRLAALLLGRLGATSITLAGSVAEAVAARPDDGWRLALIAVDEVAQALLTLRPALDPQTPILAMLAPGTELTRRACIDAGADEVLVKPLTTQALAPPLAAAAAPAADDFDRATWRSLHELFGAAGVAQMCAALVDDLPVQRQRLAAAIRDHDLAALKRLAHTLRGVGLQLGATALAGQWTVAEQAAATGERDAALRLGAESMQRYAALVERLRRESAP